MKGIFKFIDTANEVIGKGISYLILPIVIFLLFEIVARYGFNSPTIWVHETTTMLFGTYAIMLGAYVLQKGGHVNVDILYLKFSPRVRACIDICTWSLFFIFLLVLLFVGLDSAWESFVFKETEPTVFAPPSWPVKMMVPLAAFLILLQALPKYIGDIKLAFTGKEVEK